VSPPVHHRKRKEVAAIKFHAIRSESVDLSGRIRTSDLPAAAPAAAVASDDEHISFSSRPFALNTNEVVPAPEDEIASRSVVDRLVDIDAELDRCGGNRRFRNRTLLVRGEHEPMLVVAADN
jgi:hypothetical protein